MGTGITLNFPVVLFALAIYFFKAVLFYRFSSICAGSSNFESELEHVLVKTRRWNLKLLSQWLDYLALIT